MSNDTFGGASRTFTVIREGLPIPDVLNPQNQIVGPKRTILTGVSILLKSLLYIELAEDAGLLNEGKFIGSTWPDTDIMPNDVLLDEYFKNSDGSPVGFTVKGTDANPIYLRLFLIQETI